MVFHKYFSCASPPRKLFLSNPSYMVSTLEISLSGSENMCQVSSCVNKQGLWV